MGILLVFLAVGLVGAVGSWITSRGLEWYLVDSAVPSIAPGGGVIGVVWTVLFVLLAIAAGAWVMRKPRDRQYWQVVGWFVANGVLNVLWTYLFFGLHWVLVAVIETVALEVTVLVLIGLTWKSARWTAVLLIPYAIWVAFATYLAYSFWILNR